MSRHLFEIFDVVMLISTHVEHKGDLASCLLVSKVFYYSFGPIFYRSVDLKLPRSVSQQKSMPPLKSLQVNADWIRTLTLNDPFWTEYIESFVFPQLTELRLIGRARRYGEMDFNNYHNDWTNDPTMTSFTKDLDGTPAQLIQNHRARLRRVHLEGFSMISDQLNDKGVARNLQLWRAIRDLEKFEELCLTDVIIGNAEATDAFWEICNRPQLKKLQIRRVVLSGPSNRDSLPLSPELIMGQRFGQETNRPRRELQELNLFNVECDESARVMFVDMLTQSEDLRRITCQSSDNMFGKACESVAHHPSISLSPELSKTQRPSSVLWCQLVSINIHHRNCNADTILKSVSSGLEKFDIGAGELGAVGFKLLTNQHAMTLVELELSSCSGVTSAMLHEILCTCPNLEHIGGDMICEQDITTPKGEPDEDPIRGREWVCKNLRYWMIPIYVNRRGDKLATEKSPPQASRKKKRFSSRSVGMISNAGRTLESNRQHWRQFQIFERLGRFKRLFMIGIGVRHHSKAPPYAEASNGLASDGLSALELRLDRGLGALFPARGLHGIYHHSSGQQFRESDLEWLAQSFHKLKDVGTGLHPNPKKSFALYEYMKALVERRRASGVRS